MSNVYGEWTTIGELREGALFETRDGVRAVKSEYRSNHGIPECYLLASGEAASFGAPGAAAYNRIEAREIDVDVLLACMVTSDPAYARGLRDGRADAMNRLQRAADELRAEYAEKSGR